MKDQRLFERFSLTLPVRMETVIHNKRQVFKLKTRDISASGTFIDTSETFSKGTRFKIDFTVSSQRIKELTDTRCLIECEGSIVRSTSKGMAIHFDKECQIIGLKGL